MPFSGGGGGALQNHVHNNVPLQGGPLDFSNNTIASMAAGDITYSDGNALQILSAPGVPAGEVLTFPPAATAPSWAAAGGAGALELVAYSELVADANDITITINPPIAADDCPELILISQGGTQLFELNLQVNGITTTDYQSNVTRNFAGVLTGFQQLGPPYNRWSLKEGTTPLDPYYMHATITCGGTTASIAGDQRVHIESVSCTSNTSQCNYGELLINSITSIDEIKIFTYGTNRMRAGTYLAVYKRNNS